MSANSLGSASRSRPEWDEIKNVTDGLVVEPSDLGRVAGQQQVEAADHPTVRVSPLLSIVDTDQFTRAIEEIERAAAVLREGEPDLEPWTPNAPEPLEQHQPRSIWLFIGTIWITTVLVTGAATLAIASLL